MKKILMFSILLSMFQTFSQSKFEILKESVREFSLPGINKSGHARTVFIVASNSFVNSEVKRQEFEKYSQFICKNSSETWYTKEYFYLFNREEVDLDKIKNLDEDYLNKISEEKLKMSIFYNCPSPDTMVYRTTVVYGESSKQNKIYEYEFKLN